MELVFKKQPTRTSVERWERLNENTSVLIRSLDNEEYMVAMDRERRRLAQRDAKFDVSQVGVLPGEDTEHGIQCKLMGKFIVRDWKGVPDEDGNDVKYSEEAAAELLRQNIEFFIWVVKRAGEIAADSKAEKEEIVGKSSSTSAGKKSGATKPRSNAQSPSDSE